MSKNVQLVPLSSMTPEELYKSGLTDWGLTEIQSFFDDNCCYWCYPSDCFYRENFVILKSLSDIDENPEYPSDTEHLLSSTANANRLMESVNRIKRNTSNARHSDG